MCTAAIIARFQTPYLHAGHCQLLEEVRAQHQKVVVVLGVSPVTGARRNPYDFATRERMIKSAYPEVVALPLSDHPSDAVWSAQIDQLLSLTFPADRFLLYGGRDSFIPYYSGRLATQELPEYTPDSATEIRERFQDLVLDSKEFRAGILYGLHNQYAKVFPTVDIAVFRHERSQLLLGQKSGEQEWRLVGGFADPKDASYEATAMRELHEEAGPLEVSPMHYECSFQVDDWRYRQETDKIITNLYSCDLIFGTPVAGDDLATLQWFTWEELDMLLAQHQVLHGHVPLMAFLKNAYACVTPS